MADFTPITEVRAFLESGTIATARTNIGLGNVDDTTDLLKPISTPTLAVTDAITDRQWQLGIEDFLVETDSPINVLSKMGDLEVVHIQPATLAGGWPIVGQLVSDMRLRSPAVKSVTQTLTKENNGDEQWARSASSGTGWNGWRQVLRLRDGEIDEDITFSGQQELTGQLLTTANSTVNRALGDARYAEIVDKEIIVKSASQLNGLLDSTKVYIIDFDGDMGTNVMRVGSGGASVKSTGAIGTTLFSTEDNYTMIVDDSGDAGNLIIERVRFTTSGTLSKVFDVTTNAAGSVFSLDTSLFIACTEIGELNGFAVLQFDTMQDISCTDGITIDGANTLLTIEDGASVGMASGGTLFKKGASLSISNNCSIKNNTFIIGAGATLCNFDDTNFTEDGAFLVSQNNISGGGTYFSNITGNNVKCRWRDNNFDPATSETNTYVGASWECTTAIATVATAATDIKVAGTTTYAGEAWFSDTTDNAFVYDSERSVPMQINGVISISGTNGHEIQLTLRKWDDSLASYSDIQIIPKQEMSSSGSPVNIPVLAFTTLDSPDDRIELWGQNVNNTANFTMNLNSILTVTERPH